MNEWRGYDAVRANAIRRPCPKCGAKKGDRCWGHTRGGTAYRRKSMHQERLDLGKSGGTAGV